MADARHMHLIEETGNQERSEALAPGPVPTLLLLNIFIALYPLREQGAVRWLVENFRSEHWPSEFGAVSGDDWRASAEAMRALEDEWTHASL
ncbi:hypothetical protein AC629_40715 [Bradyrhizobium sp. NAS80.1]|uniref:hypothetical protein n=1 Tax=Bradyrhizobium sp. NAS80.1 TaxID=1680159 RepID=UPI0009695114|nr:hypothetical protein [Bradyrhizobium sp. NAS80.1]OKO70131.1 hypothetical protein AC629_40715 [Bradyrhizobium sp. NAS80.1]